MTDNNHAITPPDELVEKWRTAPEYASDREMLTMVSMTTRRLQEIADQAARWGADMELEACCEWLSIINGWKVEAESLRSWRRPQPPSLKERALQAMDRVDVIWATDEFGKETMDDIDAIRRALEALPD